MKTPRDILRKWLGIDELDLRVDGILDPLGGIAVDDSTTVAEYDDYGIVKGYEPQRPPTE